MSLHGKIMNLSCSEEAVRIERQSGHSASVNYKLGHRDARHAAAELANEAETAAYAEGRKDEREEWLPVLEALKSALQTAKFEKHPFRAWHEEARAAIKAVTGEQA